MSDRNVTPGEVEFLLHCHCRPEKHPRLDAPAIQNSIKRFTQDGLIEETEDRPGLYSTTRKGVAFVELLCSTPYPIERFVDPRDSKVVLI